MMVDRQPSEPPSEEEIESFMAFSSAVIDTLDSNGCLFEAITQWSPMRMVAFQQAFLTINMAADPEAFGFDNENH